MGTTCARLLVDLFLYSYEEDFIQRLLKKNEKVVGVLLHINGKFTIIKLKSSLL
jgi:hypothetical protein